MLSEDEAMADPEAAREERPILVIGGTGLVGRPIVEAMAQAGRRVRVMSRRATRAAGTFGPQVELVAGDASTSSDVERALAGCRAALICVSDLLDPYLDLRVTQAVLGRAPSLGLDRVGLISGASVDEARRHFPMIDAKFRAEEALKASGAPWVILRLTWPMESIARFLRGDKAAVLGDQPATLHPVAGADVGRMVTRAFELAEALGHTFTIHGPEPYTMEAFLRAYAARVRPGAKVSHAPLWMIGLIARLTRDRELKAAVALMRYFDELPEFGDPSEANAILGAPELTLDAWIERTSPAADAAA
jgi:NADH dehydrogenase